MRTTLTLEDDVAAALERLRASRGVTFKQAVNDVLRRGLAALDEPASTEAYATEPVSLGGLRIPDVVDISEVLLAAEGDSR